MTAERREELISAYLDGELSDVERAEVEKWLAESSQLRQLHAELRAVRSGMQSLRSYQLDHDISGAVLRRAEQSVLRGTEARPVAGTVRPAAALTSWWKRGAGWRRVVWPALAVAAALVILVYDANRRPADREVAQAPEQDEAAGSFEVDRAAREPEQQDSVPTLEDIQVERAPAVGVELKPDRDRDTFRPQVPMLENRRAERMRKDVARPTAATGASEPSIGSAAAKESLDELITQPQAAGGLVVGCTPEFLRDGKFEKLLDEKKIKWRRVGDVEMRSKKGIGEVAAKSESLAFKADMNQPQRVTYQFTATQEQVRGILAQLESRDLGRARAAGAAVHESNSEQVLPRQSLAEMAEGKASGFTLTLVASGAPFGSAEPAAAPPADESP